MKPYSINARPLEGEQTAYTAGLCYFPDNGFAPEPMGDVATIAAATAIGGPAGGIGAVLTSFLHGGAAVDQQRAQRVAYFLNQAMGGNVAAGQLILGAPPNVSGNEQKMWNDAWTTLQSSNPSVAAQVRAAGPAWLTGSGDTATNYPAMRNFTAAWAGQHSPVSNILQSVNGAVGLAPGSTSTMPLLVIGGVVAAFFLLRKR